jgi:PmbA protein
MDSKELALHVTEIARDKGATGAEILIRQGMEFKTAVRMGAVEKLLQADYRKLGMLIYAGHRAAVCATSDFRLDSLARMVAETLGAARFMNQEPATDLPHEGNNLREFPSLALCYPAASQLSADAKIERARQCEEAALKFDPRITNSEGAEFSDLLTYTTYANSLGVCASYAKSVYSLSVTPLAEADNQKQRDYWLSTHLDHSMLQSPAEIGAEAARRALRRLGARKVQTCEVPVVFDPLAASTLLKHISEAVSGNVLLRKASFLMDSLGKRVASPLMTILDDARLPGGLGSRPFDSEGIHSQTTAVIRDGNLESYLLDCYSGRKLGLKTTGNSNRELYGGPSVGPSNFYLKAGSTPPADIIASVRNGLYVTELIGFGANIVSGDYSRGAVGLWIEDGKLAFPVEEITIAGNLKDMLTGVEAVGNDLLALDEIFAPTILIGKMVVSGH